MKTRNSITTIVLLFIVAGTLFYLVRAREMGMTPPAIFDQLLIRTTETMKLTSTAFADNTTIPSTYTCDGRNDHPSLEIADVPPGAKSLVLIMDDPDAPSGDWVHWTIWNIPPETSHIAANTIPPGASEGQTDFGKPGYGGPCPHTGLHHYQFKLYALNIDLHLPTSATKRDIEAAMNGHVIAHTRLTGLYARNQ